MELGPHKIRVNAICPEASRPAHRHCDRTRRAGAGVDAESVRRVYLEQTSLEIFVDAEDIANMALFLCSDLGATISGRHFGVDGHTESLSNKQ